jgi:hypothetical protein
MHPARRITPDWPYQTFNRRAVTLVVESTLEPRCGFCHPCPTLGPSRRARCGFRLVRLRVRGFRPWSGGGLAWCHTDAGFFTTGTTGRRSASTFVWRAATASDDVFVAACSDVRSWRTVCTSPAVRCSKAIPAQLSRSRLFRLRIGSSARSPRSEPLLLSPDG